MKHLLLIAAVVVSIPLLLVALLGLRTSYRVSPAIPKGGVWTEMQSGSNSYNYMVINRNGWVTVSKIYYARVPETKLFAFPWWGLIALSLIAPSMLVLRIVRRKSRSGARGFPVVSEPPPERADN